MASVTFDGKSFMIDGKRVLIVGGSIHYARVPRASWPDVIHQAKLCGLNTIETPVFWSLHEPRPGAFNFEGELELRHFVKLVGEAGMWCILRPGPYVASAWDMGGLPGWLREVPDIAFRKNNQPFLEASGKYLSALASHLKGLQITSAGANSPILFVQNETNWNCGDRALGPVYLGELHRYLREAGFNVPMIGSNNLWQSIEGEIDCWSGSGRLLQAMRQLAMVRPDQPRMVTAIPTGSPSVFGRPGSEAVSPALLQRRLGEVLAGGGQFCFDPFHGGTNFGFRGGRIIGPEGGFVTTSHDQHAPLTEAATPGASFGLVRRISTFASSFARVLANLDAEYRPVMIDPESTARERVSIAHAQGTQGSVVFAFAGEGKASGVKGRVTVLLPDGRPAELSMGDQLVAWCLMDVQLGPRFRLDLCTFNALAHMGDVLVCYGPAGAPGAISINGSIAELEAPRGKSPIVIEHEGMTLVICNETQADTVQFVDSKVLIGASSIALDGTPIIAAGVKTLTTIDAKGKSTNEKVRPTVFRTPKAPPLDGWRLAGADAYLQGKSPRYANIDGPTSLTELGSAEGYGWYRLSLRLGAARRSKIRIPHSGDRLTFFVDGARIGAMGSGPDASDELSLSLAKGKHEIVALAENLGRASAGLDLGEQKGIFGPLLESAPMRMGKPTIQEDPVLRPLEHLSPMWGVHEDSVTIANRVRWAFQHRKKTPIIMSLAPVPTTTLVLVNGNFVRALDEGFAGPIVLDEGVLSRGNNTIDLALLDVFSSDEQEAEAIASVSADFYEGTADFGARAAWAFAKWEIPPTGAFKATNKAAMGTMREPSWWRCAFEVAHPEVPLYLDATGLTKGQIFVNGRHLGRYWVSDGAGHAVGPQIRHFIPGSWLKGGANKLHLFDELGGNPARCSLTHDAKGASSLS